MEHVDVLICTPGRSMEAAYVRSFAETIGELQRAGISWRFLSQYSSIVSEAREATATGSIDIQLDHRGPLADAVTYNKMFWIDSDIAWRPKEFLALYRSEHAIVSGVYVMQNGIVAAEGKGLDETVGSGAVVEVNSAGFGFIAVQSGVFESLDRPWFSVNFESRWTSGGKRVRMPIGEDVAWCRRVRDGGHKIYLDTSVRVQHLKVSPLIFQTAKDNPR